MSIKHKIAVALLAVSVCLILGVGYVRFELSPDLEAKPVAVPVIEAAPPAFSKSSVVIKKADGKEEKFSMEIANTEEQLQYGLMFRREMANDAGMLFIFDAPQKLIMWMKNTYIPLDMLFVDSNGKIIKIIENTTPLNLAALSSDAPALGVIELIGGEAGRRGIKVGDIVAHEAFKAAAE
ncbi:MAG: DUF192 domain-containing protein [Alphaproteobacteria bacterium]|nr:DUF192 domain-containing protein [Alphaproteobacteria bacterium]